MLTSLNMGNKADTCTYHLLNYFFKQNFITIFAIFCMVYKSKTYFKSNHNACCFCQFGCFCERIQFQYNVIIYVLMKTFSYFLQVKHFRALQEQASTYLDLLCSMCDLSDVTVKNIATDIQLTKQTVWDELWQTFPNPSQTCNYLTLSQRS